MKKSRTKLRLLLVAALALVLCVMCVTSTTFSWFTRPKEKTGGLLTWNASYDVSGANENLSITTYQSADDGETYGDTPVTAFTNTSGVSAGKRICYRTDITNSGGTAENVSLYLSNLDLSGTSGEFYLGTNDPDKTYKCYSESASGTKIESSIDKKNIYVGFNTNQTYTPTNYQVHWWVQSASSDSGDSTVNDYFSPNKTGNYLNSTYNMTYATIPWRADAVKLRQDNYWYGSNNTDISTNNTICVFLNNDSTDVDYAKSSTAAGINTFYSSAALTVGSTVSLAAEAQGTISYSSSNTDVATVDSSGTVTGISAGTATITVKSKGIYGDTLTAECKVTVSESAATIQTVPIVTNVTVGAATTDDSGNPVNTTVSVYWYIKNGAGSDSLTYNIDDLILTL